MKSYIPFPTWLILAITLIGPPLQAQTVCLVSADDRVAVGALEQFRAAATKQWNQGRLKVVFVDGDTPDYAAIRLKIKDAAKHWEKFANIQLEFEDKVNRDPDGNITDRNIDIAIQLKSDFFFKLRTYQSLYGPDAHSRTRAKQPVPSMWLIFPLDTNAEEIQRVTLHEFGHALGLIHEHKRPDAPIKWNREAALKYYSFTGWSEAMIEEQVMKQFEGPILKSSPFDPTSIMIYPIPAGLASITTDWTTKLSPMDKLFIGALYPFGRISRQAIKVNVETEIEIAGPGEIISCPFSVERNGQYVVKSSGCPAVIGLMGTSLTGPLSTAPAAEGDPAGFTVNLKADSTNSNRDPPGTHYLYLRHAEGRSGKGRLKVQVERLQN
jgi:Astacin (Peptidase family M12A).